MSAAEGGKAAPKTLISSKETASAQPGEHPSVEALTGSSSETAGAVLLDEKGKQNSKPKRIRS